MRLDPDQLEGIVREVVRRLSGEVPASPSSNSSDLALSDRVITAVQNDGVCWMGGTTWRGRRYMRISISNWSTTEADVDRSVDAIERLLAELH